MEPNKLQYSEIPTNTKTLIHAISILPLPLIFGIGMSLAQKGSAGEKALVLLMVFLILVIAVVFFYYLAGGFDWKAEKLSTMRGLFFFLLSGVVYGLIFYGYWYLVRLIVAKTNKVPLADLRGKLLTKK